MVTLTIDDRTCTVAEGTTILDAARRLGIRIPTLCHVDGFPASASCFLCAVQVGGKEALTPSCAVPVSDGMVVLTGTEEVRASRKMVLELLLSDHVGDCVGPCSIGCPARFDIPGFLTELSAGEFRRGAEMASDFLTLPRALGRICPRLCEQRCHQSDAGDAVSIASLHRYAADRDAALPASGPDVTRGVEGGASARPHPSDAGPATSSRYVPRKDRATGKRAAIVGAGPAGLTAAYHLLRRGHAVALFDAHDVPGGMLRHGIPAFRLPHDVLADEVEIIRQLGAEFRMRQRLGADLTLETLRSEFDAVFLAIGAQRSRALDCPGEELALDAIDLLARVAEGRPPSLGGSVLVVGGGNTAMDASRTAVRLGAESVTLLYRRSRREMPCLMAEVEAAESEGVTIETLVAPVALQRQGDGVRLTCLRMKLGTPDLQGRPRPVPIPGSGFAIDAACVISAIGQVVDSATLGAEGLALSPRGIAANAVTLETSLPGVFAGGDGVTGPDLAVRAVAAGKLAAISIDQYLGGRPVQGDPEMVSVVMGKLDELELAEFFRGIEQSPRTPVPHPPLDTRVRSFEEVEPGLTAEVAAREASRCLNCGCSKATTCHLRQLATEYGADPLRFQGARRKFRRDNSHPEIVYEPGKCILCGACVAVAEAAGEALGLAIVGRGFEAAVAVPLQGTMIEALPKAAEQVAAACPTGAFAMKGAGCGCAFGR
jgi:formate dehydrogenase major subunit